MARASLKNRAARNKRTLHRHVVAVGVTNGIYVILRLLVLKNWFCLAEVFAAALFFVFYYFAFYKLLYKAGMPSHSADGELLDGGADLNIRGGFVEFAFDALYLTIFVQLGSLWSRWFLATYLLIPTFLIFHFRDSIASLVSAALGRNSNLSPEENPRGGRRGDQSARRKDGERVRYRTVRH